MADYRFNATGLEEQDHIYIELPNGIIATIARGDIGYAVDFENRIGGLVELGWVFDDDLADVLTDDEGIEG